MTTYALTPDFDEWSDALAAVDRMNRPQPQPQPECPAAPTVRELSPQQTLVLAYCRNHPGRQQSEIADALGIVRTSVNTALMTLRQQGLVIGAGVHFARRYYAIEQEEPSC